ncbi:MAG: serine/threonine protein kinase [Oligoflexia bacterium]|nr:serine/threonine protein kinase [Oligoflexia bacterium]
MKNINNLKHDFFSLTPSSILDCIDDVLKIEDPNARTSGRALALNSLENRVYDIELEDDFSVVAKFYRPGRWTEDQIYEEHSFLFQLDEKEIPVVCPFTFSGESVFKTPEGILFSLFPKVKGRLLDELDTEQLKTMGRYLARIHNIGEMHPFKFRLKMNADSWGKEPLQYLNKTGVLGEYEKRYNFLAHSLIEMAQDFFTKTTSISLHGDCHLGNCLWEAQSPYFIDFDDCVLGPSVQDLWMISRGRGEESEKERDCILSGYEVFRAFDRSQLKAIELLRNLRVLYYSAWIAKRWDDPAFELAFPTFKSPRYWEEEIQCFQEALTYYENS